MRNTTRAAAFVVAAVTGSMLLTACGGSTDDSADKPKKQVTADHASEINPQPADKVKQGGQLRLSVANWITQFNGNQVQGGLGDRTTMTKPMLPSVWDVDAQGAFTPDKDYIESAVSGDKGGKQVLTYKINPKAKWSDGTALSYRDFEAMWKANGLGDEKYLIVDPTGYEDIESVKAGANDQEVVVTMKKQTSQWQAMFWQLLPAKFIDTPEKFNKAWVEKVPATAGPYKVGSIDKASQTVTLVPDEKWWGEKPKLDKIIFRALDRVAAVDAYLNRELDAVSAGNADYYKRTKKTPGTEFRIGAPWDMTHIVFGANGNMADVKVRQAIQLAINTKTLADIPANGMPVDYKTLGNHFYMGNQKGYQDNSGKYGKGDIAAAGKVLDEAGWKAKNPGEIRTKDGKPLVVNFLETAGASATIKSQDAASQAMLKQAGIDMKINNVPENDYFDKYITAGNFEMVSYRSTSYTGLASDFFASYRDPKGKQLFQNNGKIVTPGGEAKFREALTAKTPEEAVKLQQEVDKLVWDAGHTLPTYQTPAVWAVQKKVANYGSPGMASVDWTKVGFMK
ncbi:ABC transporter family substrate-binding protein [Streptomyces sp. NPDC048442]|uniref:ABC transporter family substrate-binding protein n=1 Tax=Streptomyces sp. NPDC048442 TaxID=3154823 RepID=UPI003415A124